MKTMYGIQALRGVAAMLVVFYHATQLLANQYQITPFGGFFLFGFAGVHVFFVLSGFIIFTIHAADIGKPRRLFSYATKRFIRIYPIHWITLAILSSWYLYRGTITPRDVYQNIGLLVQPPHLINPVCWTLSAEVMFYIVFAILILNRILGSVVILLWAVGVVATDLYGLQLDFLSPHVFHKYGILFLIGLAASQVLRRLSHLQPMAKDRLAYRIVSGGLVMFCLTAIYCFINNITDWDLWIVTLGFGLAAGMFMMCTLSETLERFFQERSLLDSLGNASYSIYLLHYPLLSAAISFWARHFSITRAVSIDVAFVVLCALCALAGWLFYSYIERPLLKFMRKPFSAAAMPKPTSTVPVNS